MALDSKILTFTANTSTGTQDLTGTSFTPKTAIVWWSRATNTVDTFVENSSLGYGFTDGTTSICINGTSEDNQASSDTAQILRDDAIITTLDLTGTVTTIDSVATFSSWLSNGMRINWTDAPAAAFKFHVLFLGGTDITNVSVGKFTCATATGNQDITAPGFTPDGVIFAYAGLNNTFNETGTDSVALGIGAGTDASNGWGQYVAIEDGRATMDTWQCYSHSNAITLGSATTGTYTYNASYSGGITNGFRINWGTTDIGNTAEVAYLAIKGCSIAVGNNTEPASTGNQTITTSKDTKAVMIFGLNTGTADAVQTGCMMTIGGGTSSSEMATVVIDDTDNSAASTCGSRYETDSIYLNFGVSATITSSAVIDEASLSSVSSTGFVLNWSNIGSARPFRYIAFGNAAGGGTTPVTETNTHKYNITAKVTRTRTHKYNITGKVTRTRTHKYNILQFVRKCGSPEFDYFSRTYKYNILNKITETNTHKYNIIGKITETNTHRYQIEGKITETNTHKYNILNSVTRTRTHLYNLLNSVSDTNTHKYNIIGKVTETNTHIYDVKGKVTATKTHKYHIIAQVTTTKTHKYNVIGKVTESNTHKYNIIGKITATKTHLYNIIGKVIETNTHKYNIVRTVSATKVHLYNVIGKVTETNTHKYNILNSVTETNTHKYNLLERIALSATHKYNIIGKVTRTRTHKYNVEQAQGTVSTTKTHKYHIEGKVTETNTHKYNILQFVRKCGSPEFDYFSRVYKYNILQAIQRTRTHKYNIIQQISKSTTHKFNVVRTVSATRVHLYNVLARITETNTHKYNILNQITETNTHKYNIIAKITRTRTHKYDVEPPPGTVSTTKTHKYHIEIKVTETNTHKYNIIAPISTTNKTHKYNILHSVQDSATHKYNIIEQIEKNTTHKYNVIKKVSTTKTHLYNIEQASTQVTKNSTHIYNVLVASTKTATHKYNIIVSIARTVTHKFHIISSIAKSVTHKFNIIQKITETNTHKYNILNRVTPNRTRTHKYNIIGKVQRTRTHKYNIIGRIYRQKTHRYQMGGKVTTTRTHIYDVGISVEPPELGGSVNAFIKFPERVRIIDIIANIQNKAIANIEILVSRPPRDNIAIATVAIAEYIRVTEGGFLLPRTASSTETRLKHRAQTELIFPQVIEAVDNKAICHYIGIEEVPSSESDRILLQSQLSLRQSESSLLSLTALTQIKTDEKPKIKIASATMLQQTQETPKIQSRSNIDIGYTRLNRVDVKAPEIMTRDRLKTLKALVNLLSNDRLFE
jgi:hypothetical protein